MTAAPIAQLAPGYYRMRWQDRRWCAVTIVRDDAAYRDGWGCYINMAPVSVDDVWPRRLIPIDLAEHDAIVARSQRNSTNRAHASMQDEAADLIDDATWLVDLADKIDTVKRITACEKTLDGERLGATRELRDQTAAINKEYNATLRKLADAKTALLAEIAREVPAGEQRVGDAATAYWQAHRVVEITGPVPADYMVPNVEKIEAALRAGLDVPGARLADHPQLIVK